MDIATIALIILLVVVTILYHHQVTTRPVIEQQNVSDLVESVAKLSRRLSELETESAIERGNVRQLDNKIYNLTVILRQFKEGLIILRSQLINGDLIPEWDLPDEINKILDENIFKNYKHVLVKNLSDSFTDEEIQGLCFSLNIIYDDLVGKSRLAKIISLVNYVISRNMMQELIIELQELRPKVSWSLIS